MNHEASQQVPTLLLQKVCGLCNSHPRCAMANASMCMWVNTAGLAMGKVACYLCKRYPHVSIKGKSHFMLQISLGPKIFKIFQCYHISTWPRNYLISVLRRTELVLYILTMKFFSKPTKFHVSPNNPIRETIFLLIEFQEIFIYFSLLLYLNILNEN